MKRERGSLSAAPPPAPSLSVRFSAGTPRSPFAIRTHDRRSGRLHEFHRPAVWLAVGILAIAALSVVFALHVRSSSVAAKINSTGKFLPTVLNFDPPPSEAPVGMLWIPGGEFSMGAEDPPEMNQVGMEAAIDSRPIHRVHVDGSWMLTLDY
jgi:hypothetical protein